MTIPMASVTRDADSLNSGLSNLVTRFVSSFYLKNINFQNNYFLKNPVYGFSANLGQQIQQSNRVFVISRESFVADDGTNLWKYSSVSDYLIEPSRATPNINSFSYSQEERERLEKLYGDIEPSLQVSLDEAPIREDIGIQNSVVGEQISYNSLSSLGAISQEGFTVSATTGSVTGLITEQTETITDVGGLSGAGRDRTIESTDAVITTPFGVITGTRTVTTRGY